MNIVLVLGLLLGCVLWGAFVDFIYFPERIGVLGRLASGLGSGGLVFFATGIPAFVVHACQRFHPSKRRTAIKVWGLMALAIMIILGLGGMYGLSRP